MFNLLLNIFVGIFSSAYGYGLAYLILHEPIITALAHGNDAAGVRELRGILEDFAFQFTCGILPAGLLGIILVLGMLSLKSYKNASDLNRSLRVGCVCFIVGFIFYFPQQICILFGYVI